VPGDPSKPFEDEAQAKAAKTWNGEWWKMGGGGAPWDAIAYDPDADLLYVGTGNGSPWNQRIRSPKGGDNLYLSSIIALKPDTGKLAWHYQTTPGETWDYTAVQQITLADLTINGRPRKVLMQAPKNGFFYVLDRITGELISAEPYSKVTWASRIDKKTGRPVELPGARFEKGVTFVYPGPSGAHNWHPMAFNPQTGLMYIPEQRGAFPYSDANAFQYTSGRWNLGVETLPNTQGVNVPAPDGPPGSLLAWDPIAQKARWSVPHTNMVNGGILTTAGNLVFQGTAEGTFAAYSADKGAKLWEVNLGTSVMAAPSTYTLDGKQYVSVMAGWGGASALFGAPGTGYKVPGRLWTFVLNGTKPEPIKGRDRPKVTAIPATATPSQLAQGAALYARNCPMCHGNAAASGGAIADLRYATPATYNNLKGIILDGQLVSLGMPSFRPFLNEADADLIKAFLISKHNEVAGK
jgi:quinohemoprotein ethanol dehydrogenase